MGDFRKVCNITQDRFFFVWKSNCKWLQWAHKLGIIVSHKGSGVVQMVLARLMKSQIRCLPACDGQVVEEFNKETIVSARNSVWENAAPLAFALVLNNLVSPSLSLAPLKVLP